MFNRKLIFITVVSTLILACMYEDAQASKREPESMKFITEILKMKNSGVTDVGNPVFDVIGLILRAVTYLPRLVYRMIFNIMVTFGLLMLGCTILPVVRCVDQDVNGAVQHFLGEFREELQFFAPMDMTAS